MPIQHHIKTARGTEVFYGVQRYDERLIDHTPFVAIVTAGGSRELWMVKSQTHVQVLVSLYASMSVVPESIHLFVNAPEHLWGEMQPFHVTPT